MINLTPKEELEFFEAREKNLIRTLNSIRKQIKELKKKINNLSTIKN